MSSHLRCASLIDFEPDDDLWPDLGVNIQVLAPGQPNCKYHSEPVQEDFLVLQGECLVILEGAERRLRQWDFVHCRRDPARLRRRRGRTLRGADDRVAPRGRRALPGQ